MDIGWKIPAGGQRQTMRIVAGRPVDGVEVTFILTSGSFGTVFLPADGFSAQAATEAINARAAEMVALESA